ncbi:MAG: hypothetical protein OXG61_03720 [Chloroflexi bacterium]|nr:hypothetical protein [Chloroflexota bacterium]
MRALLEATAAFLALVDGVIESVARPWRRRQEVMAHLFLTTGSTPRYRRPRGRPRRRR